MESEEKAMLAHPPCHMPKCRLSFDGSLRMKTLPSLFCRSVEELLVIVHGRDKITDAVRRTRFAVTVSRRKVSNYFVLSIIRVTTMMMTS